MNRKTLYLLDTNMVTYLVTGRSPEVRRQYREAEGNAQIGVSAITEAELRYGLEKKPEATRLRAYVTEFLERTECFAWDSATAETFSRLGAQTEVQGLTLGLMDLLIAAHASSLGATLITHDRAIHRMADFLSVLDWATDL